MAYFCFNSNFNFYDAQIDAYLQSGNVLVKGLHPDVEKVTIEALRQFFFDYGALLNFSVKALHQNIPAR